MSPVSQKNSEASGTAGAELLSEPSSYNVGLAVSMRLEKVSEGQSTGRHGDPGTEQSSEEDASDSSMSDAEAAEAARSLTEFAAAFKGGHTDTAAKKGQSPAERLARRRMRKRRNAVQSRKNKKARIQALKERCEELTKVEHRLLREREVLRTKIRTIKSVNAELEESRRHGLENPAHGKQKRDPAKKQGRAKTPDVRTQASPSVATSILGNTHSHPPGGLPRIGFSHSHGMYPMPSSNGVLFSALVDQYQDPRRFLGVPVNPWRSSHSSFARMSMPLQGAPQSIHPLLPPCYLQPHLPTERRAWVYDQYGVPRGPAFG